MTLDTLIQAAIAEDIGEGDITSQLLIPPNTQARAVISTRSTSIVAGIEAARLSFLQVDASCVIRPLKNDGDSAQPGEAILEIFGPARSLLAAERVALNFLQHLSGIATLTSQFVKAISGTKARILDTRKTTPGWRELEKAAVRAGGGTSHRMGLYDMVMIKDNHIATAGSIPALQPAIHAAKSKNLRVEIEVDNLTQFQQAVKLQGVDIILLDNMPIEEIRRAALSKPPGILLEASGGINLANAREIAETGVDFLSIGALTHSAPAADIGLDFIPSPPNPLHPIEIPEQLSTTCPRPQSHPKNYLREQQRKN